MNDTQNRILAALFASGEPLEASRLAEALEISLGEAREQCAAVADWVEALDCALEVRRLDDSFQLCTKVGYGDFIRQVLALRRNTPLSSAALEVLAIIAYNQPVTKSFVEQVRGVDSSSVVNALAEKGLVEEAGRLDLPGKPVSFRTTANFLRCFGLQSLSQLPEIRLEEVPQSDSEKGDQLDFAEALAENQP